MAARKKLRELRKSLGVTGTELAEAAGVTKQAYSLLEYGKMAARPERMAPMNEIFRERRVQRIQELQREIEYLESFRIDETLYLLEEAEGGRRREH